MSQGQNLTQFTNGSSPLLGIELRRLEMATRADLVSDFREVAEGSETIRAFRETARFEARLAEKIDLNTVATYCEESSLCWLGLALDVIGSVGVFLVLVLALALSESGTEAGIIFAHVIHDRLGIWAFLLCQSSKNIARWLGIWASAQK